MIEYSIGGRIFTNAEHVVNFCQNNVNFNQTNSIKLWSQASRTAIQAQYSSEIGKICNLIKTRKDINGLHLDYLILSRKALYKLLTSINENRDDYRELDLGRNSLDHDAFELFLGIIEIAKLEKLSIANIYQNPLYLEFACKAIISNSNIKEVSIIIDGIYDPYIQLLNSTQHINVLRIKFADLASIDKSIVTAINANTQLNHLIVDGMTPDHFRKFAAKFTRDDLHISTGTISFFNNINDPLKFSPNPLAELLAEQSPSSTALNTSSTSSENTFNDFGQSANLNPLMPQLGSDNQLSPTHVEPAGCSGCCSLMR